MAPQVTLTLELTHETVNALHALVDVLNGENNVGKDTPKTDTSVEQMSSTDGSESKRPTGKKEPKPAKPAKPAPAPTEETPEPDAEPESNEPAGEDATVTFTDIRAKALVFSQTNQQTKLKEIFAKFSAKKLSDIAEDDFPELMADMEAALNG